MHHMSFSTHLGTHMDAPFHFSLAGKTVDAYGPEELIFSRVCLLEVKKTKPAQVIEYNDLCEKNIPRGAQLLLIKTCFQKFRKSPPYATHNPGLSHTVAEGLRKDYPSIRAVGMDFISVSSFQNRERGREAHRAFLCPKKKARPILLIEDMDLSRISSRNRISQVMVMPLRVQGADGSPCTVAGYVKV